MSPTKAPSYERLAAQDSSFVKFEGAGTHVHVTAVATFETGPLANAAGGLDMERVRAYVAGRLHRLKHYRQRLAFTPVQRHPIWVDDERFELAYHVRHTALPRPGDEVQLRELAGRITSQPLERTKPLWELWFVEGLEGGRFAMVAKIHHCMVDGVSGVGALTTLLSPNPDEEIEEPRPWKPRPAPGVLGFLTDGAAEGVGFTSSALQTAGDAILHPQQTAESLAEGARAAWQTLSAGFTPPGDTPLNGPVSSLRRIDWCTLDLQDIRDHRKRLDGSINDVVLSIVAGATRRTLKRRRVKLSGLNFRVIVPVDTRRGPEDDAVANRVSAWFLSMPVGTHDPVKRFQKIRTQTRRLKETNAALGIDAFMRFADWSGSTRLTFWGVNLTSMVRPYNLIVTNVHGPQFPLYLLGAPLLDFVPALPLFEGQGLAVAAMSYMGKVRFGLTGDWKLMPDLGDFRDDLVHSFAELQSAAERRR